MRPKIENEPLKTWNRPKCGARTRNGNTCSHFAAKNGRCRYHGGASTGPRTPEGLANSKRANWRHGLYTQEAKAEHKQVRELCKQTRELLREIQNFIDLGQITDAQNIATTC